MIGHQLLEASGVDVVMDDTAACHRQTRMAETTASSSESAWESSALDPVLDLSEEMGQDTEKWRKL